MAVKASGIIRIGIVAALWAFFCGFMLVRMQAAGEEMTLLSLSPIPISAVIVFMPLYRKYIRGNASGPSAPQNGRKSPKHKS